MSDVKLSKGETSQAAGLRRPSAEEQLTRLSELLAGVESETAARAPYREPLPVTHEEQLAAGRLGIATGLFQSLRAKHEPTAAHCLRVALGCSSWLLRKELSDSECYEIEVAALLHDVGKIGVPDHLLLKPGKLLGEELLTMEQHRFFGQRILQSCCISPTLLETYRHVPAWFNGARHGFEKSGPQLPLGARMIAIVDAFDSMTTDHVYRRAMSRERALAELFEYAGTQFDPELVQEFYSLDERQRERVEPLMARRWLQEVQLQVQATFWGQPPLIPEPPRLSIEEKLQQKLLDSMHDGVVFVDNQLKILLWNRAAERLTGITWASVRERRWSPDLVALRDESGRYVDEAACPLAIALRSGVQVLRRYSLSGAHRRAISVDLHVSPVLAHDGSVLGSALLLHDASSQITLEERVQKLHERAIRDPLTQVANRAEFNRVHELFVAEHLESGLPCSLIICDLDHFKKVNDTYGHPAGDAALIAFAQTLQRNCRKGDLVARYGGEEFVMLCANCTNSAATARADEIRCAIAGTPLEALSGNYITASFGVTEIQGGDTAETMLRRADRALLQAKDNGRNMVVQLGTGIQDPVPTRRRWWTFLQSKVPAETVLTRQLLTAVPLNVTAEKLKGFLADHHAEILSLQENHVSLTLEGSGPPLARGPAWTSGTSPARVIPFVLDLQFQEWRGAAPADGSAAPLQTLVQVTIRPKRSRDRRLRDIIERARQILFSLKSYLMAHDVTEADPVTPAGDSPGVLSKACNALEQWLST